MEEPHAGQDPSFDRKPDERSQTRTRRAGATAGEGEDHALIRDADERSREEREALRARGFDAHNGTASE